MELQEALRILEQHNKWRRGADVPMVIPKLIEESIDLIVNKFKK